MYTSYFYPAGATAANILADMVALLNGETNKDNLSASCDKALTTIDASVRVAGWVTHDANAGVNAVCLRAPVADNPAQFKYLVLDTNTAGYIITKVYETWDPATHTGTFMASNSSTVGYSQRLNVAAGGRLDISASVRHAMFFSLQAGVYGSANGNSPTGVLERTRLSPWDTAANGYLPVVFFSYFPSALYETRRVNNLGADVSAANASVDYVYRFGGSTNAPNPPNTVVPCDATKTNFKHAMYEFGFEHVAHFHLGGMVSDFTDIWLTTHGFGSPFDTLVESGKEYMIWTVGNPAFRFAVRKG